jgi:hypothetical protein
MEDEAIAAFVVIPAHAGIQLGTGYFFGFQKVACPLSGSWIPARLSHRLIWPE